MNTFMPLPSYAASAKALDDKRLGKQRIEARQILETLLGQSTGWYNHPATKMWRGHEWQLCNYGLATCAEWKARGFNDNVALNFRLHAISLPEGPLPPWMGDERLHASHRANLIRKDPQHYRDELGWTEEPRQGYFWPEERS